MISVAASYIIWKLNKDVQKHREVISASCYMQFTAVVCLFQFNQKVGCPCNFSLGEVLFIKAA